MASNETPDTPPAPREPLGKRLTESAESLGKQAVMAVLMMIVVSVLTTIIMLPFLIFRSLSKKRRVKKLFAEPARAHDDAAQLCQTIYPQFTALVAEVEKLAPDAVRKQHQSDANTLKEQYGQAASRFRQAAAKCADARKSSPPQELAQSLESLAQSCEFSAELCERMQQMITAIMDPSVTNTDDLRQKLNRLAAEIGLLTKRAEASFDRGIPAATS
jgi:division protein CdvB (Snf7/Vps24/ESCRT-III family)